ncbi:MAG: MFS transporter [Deltaproteobacteria bacterium]|nr:MFS transporter [Deltaproteobacteria bacterium]
MARQEDFACGISIREGGSDDQTARSVRGLPEVFPFIICTGIVYSILAIYMSSLGLTKSQVGFLYTAGATAGVIGSPLWGMLADRFGRKKILTLSMAGFAFVFLGYAISSSYEHLFVIQVGEGLSWGAMGSAASALIADLVSSEERGKAMGIYNMTWNFGWIVGPSMGGVLSDHIGFTTTFIICTGITLSGFILAVLFIPARPGHRGDVSCRDSIVVILCLYFRLLSIKKNDSSTAFV